VLALLPAALRHPARLLPLAFLAVIAVGTLLLMLPLASAQGEATWVVDALFTAVSATCVTGLSVVDTQLHWSFLGQLIILALIQVGGFGITTFATLIVIVVTNRLGLATRLAAAHETKTLAIGDVRLVLLRVAITMAICQTVGAAVLTARFLLVYQEPAGQALWDGVFHAVSAWNNAGFSIYSNNLVRYVEDPVVVITICLLIIVGGIGFPVLHELARRWRRPARWSVHTRLTVLGTAALLVVGFVGMLWFEFRNPATMGFRDLNGKALVALFHGVQPRTAGFNTINVEAMRQESLILQIMLMFVGGGSAGTAGGVKVGTVAILAFVVLAEARGTRDVVVARRTIPATTIRQAGSIFILAASVIFLGAMAITALSDVTITLGPALFEATSAFATVGLSVGVTGDGNDPVRLVLCVLMFMGRIGPIAAFALFAARSEPTYVTYPESRPIVG
jgi:potassium uptake TrkH family protein